MTDDIKKTIAEVDRVLAHPLQNRDWRGIVRLLRDALEAEHKQAEEWRVLWEKAANGVLTLQAERDALHGAIQSLIADLDDARAHGEIYTYGMVQDRLSRAIDTKEKP